MKPQRNKLGIPLSVQDLNRELANTIREITGDTFIHADNVGDTVSLRLSIQNLLSRLPQQWGMYTITGTATGAGIYTLQEQMLNGTNADHTATLNLSNVYDDGDNPTVYGCNLAEDQAPSGSHGLLANGALYVIGRKTPRITSDTSDSNPGNFYVEFELVPYPQAADLSNPTGSAGTNGPPPTAASYTYDAKIAGTSQTIGTGLSVKPARQKGHVTAATFGYVDNIGGTLYIVSHDEVIDTSSCT